MGGSNLLRWMGLPFCVAFYISRSVFPLLPRPPQDRFVFLSVSLPNLRPKVLSFFGNGTLTSLHGFLVVP